MALHPFGLSYYNLLVGGLPGAERLGLELTYWSDAVDRVLLDRLRGRGPPGQSAALAPTLYPGQGVLARPRARWSDATSSSRTTRPPADADWVVVSRRTAYWRPELRGAAGQRDGQRSSPVAARGSGFRRSGISPASVG